tara:strand:- start:120 stop:626 length:507 start_codon:yes stop_codon:yes gene_type:complete
MNFFNNLKIKKNNFLQKENIYYLLFITILFLLDRLSKIIIISKYNDTSYFLNDFLNFNLIWNQGIGFGLLSFSSNLLYNSITVLIGIVICVLIYFSLNSKGGEKIIFLTIVGGALGNFYDRIIYKAVPDFIDLHYHNFHWFTFNLADIFITLGIIAYILGDLILKKNE